MNTQNQVRRNVCCFGAAVLIDNKPVILQRAGSAAQEKHSDCKYLDGERAVLEQNSRVLFGPCVAGPLPTIQRERIET